MPNSICIMDESQKDKGDALLDVQEVAARLKVSSDWAYDAVKYHNLPRFRLNPRLWRFHWPTMLAWLQKRR